MRLLVDANLAPRVAVELSASGHDAVHVFDVGLGQSSDPDILEFAAGDSRVIVSSDSDFGALLARQRRSTPSFVLLRHRNDLTVTAQIALLKQCLPQVEDELAAGAVVTIARGRIRARRLPFGSDS